MKFSILQKFGFEKIQNLKFIKTTKVPHAEISILNPADNIVFFVMPFFDFSSFFFLFCVVKSNVRMYIRKRATRVEVEQGVQLYKYEISHHSEMT